MINRKKMVLLGLAVFFVCAISSEVFAGPYGKPPRGPGGSGKQWKKSHSGPIDTPREQKAFGKYDKNNDNHLGPREAKYRDLDENRDGKIQPIERKYDATHPYEKDGPRDAQWQKSHSGKIDTPLEEKKLGEYDNNNDNVLGPKERKYMRADLNKDGTVDEVEKKHLQNHNDGSPRDLNNDGALDWKDKKIAQDKGPGPHAKPPIRDMNGDGTIDDADRKIMIKSHVNNPNEARMDTDDDHHVSKEEFETAKEIRSAGSETETAE